MIIPRYHHSFLKVLMFFGLPSSPSMATTTSNTPKYQLMQQVLGYEHRQNDLIFFPKSPSKSIVYYFGGDIQDVPERMKSSRESKRYEPWNLVATGEMLSRRRFPDCAIAIIRPNEMKDAIFSRFSNFVPKTSEHGDPIAYDTTDLVALRHLRALDKQLTTSSDITLVGFSKGCVVLNQILHELTALRMLKSENDLSNFTSRIRSIVWLDGGHNNGDRAMIWPTDEDLLATLVEGQIRTEVYVTPFQINGKDPYKKHHTEQYQRFSDLLRCQSTSSSNRTINQMFFGDEPPSIDKHFQLLTVF